MKIILKSLTLDNFAGSGKETHNFFEHVTTVSADNGVGKTRLQNAWIYLLFDKNAEDRKDFNIKNTFDLEKNRQEHIVSAIINVNGSDIEMKKIYKEKWQKKQGSKQTEMTGNETLYYYDGVPVPKGEYNSKINALVQEDLFKLLTNVSFFNKMPWTKQREIILKLAPEVTDGEIAEGNAKFTALLAALTNNKTLKEYKAQISAEKKKLKAELDAIPVRIDEVMKAKPEAEDFEALSTELEGYRDKLLNIDITINDQLQTQNQANESLRVKQQAISDLKLKKQSIENNIKLAENSKGNDLVVKKQECRNKIDNIEREIKSIKDNSGLTVENLKSKNTQIEELRAKFTEVNASELKFNPDDFKCPTCHSPIKPEEAEAKEKELSDNFIANKKKRLEDLNLTGGALKDTIGRFNQDLVDYDAKLTEAESNLEVAKAEFLELNKQTPEVGKTIEEIILENPEHIAIVSEITNAEAAIEKTEPLDQSALKAQKTEISAKIDELKKRLNNKEVIANSDKRIEELEKQESDFAQKLADLENTENDITEFDKAKINAVEATINAKFEIVKFKLFDFQVNGQEVPICEAYIGGVPYSDTNYANKVIAGLDVIATLSKEHDVYAPIFIDNSESISYPKEMETQVIYLRVVEGIKTLTIS